MLITRRDDVDITCDVLYYERVDTSGDPSFKAEGSVSSGYTDITSLDNWDKYWWNTAYVFKDFRDLLIADYLPSWAILSSADKKTLVRSNVWPDSESESNLDLLYTGAERDAFMEDSMARLDAGHNLYAYDTTTQAIAVDDTHQDLDFSDNTLTSSWKHTEGQAEFTCKKTGRYFCVLEVYMQKTSAGTRTANLRACFDGVEIPGSHSGIDLITNDEISMFSSSFQFDGVNGKDLIVEIAGNATNIQTVAGPNPGSATVATSATINIFYQGN